MKAIIPAAGLGTRFLPATKAVPKELLPVLSKPTIQYVVEEALASSANEVIIISNKQKQAIAEHFSPDEDLAKTLEASGKTAFAAEVRHAAALAVSFVEQATPLGLGHAVYCAADKVWGTGPTGTGPTGAEPMGTGPVGAEPMGAEPMGAEPMGAEPMGAEPPEPFYVLLGDVLVPDNSILPRLHQISKDHGNASVIAVYEVPRDQVSRFGIIAGEPLDNEVWRITNMVEKPAQEEAPSNLAIFGRYLLTPRIMELLAHTQPGAGGEIQLTDAMVKLLDEEEMYAFIINPEAGFDVGTIETWLATNIKLASRDAALSPMLTSVLP